MRALIFGLDLGGSTASQVSSHERTVKTRYLESAPAGTTADIVITSNKGFSGYAPVLAWIPFPTSGFYPTDVNAFYDWVLDGRQNDYDVVIFSYNVDAYYDRVLEKLISNTSIQAVFCAIGNDSGFPKTFGNNIFKIGGGVTENIAQHGYRNTGWTQAINGSTLTSYTNATAGGYFTRFMGLELTKEQTRKSFLQSFPEYPDKDPINGYGKVPETATIPESYDIFPPTTLDVYYEFADIVDGLIVAWNMRIYFCPFILQADTSYNVYVNDELAVSGLGTLNSPGGYIGSELLRYLPLKIEENGTFVVSISAVTEQGESGRYLYATDTITITNISEPDPEPEPTPEPPEPEPLPPVNPNPNVFLTRGANLTAITDGGGDATEWRYRTDIGNEWTTASGDFSITAEPTKTYEVQARVSSGGIFTDWSESAWSSATQESSQICQWI
jgi:hypothetical protein